MIAARAVSRALPALHPAADRWRHRSELRWAAALAPRVAARLEATPPGLDHRGTPPGPDHRGTPPGPDHGGAPAGAWRTERVHWTGTSVAVAIVARAGDGRRVVVKLPTTAEGAANLRRQAQVLARLWSDGRLHAWRAALPRPLHQGELTGRYYCVEELLPGREAARLASRGRHARALLDASARLIDGLHTGTASRRRVDAGTLGPWVHLPLRRLERFAETRARRGELRAAVDRLRQELTGSLLGRTVRLAWIHGDFWPGNILAETGTGHITGVVDWDQAAADQLPLHDLLHLYLHARRLARGEELGDVVVAALADGVPATIGVPAGRVHAWTDGIPARTALLLCWLRHATLFLDSDGHRDNRYWLRNNVEKVLLRV